MAVGPGREGGPASAPGQVLVWVREAAAELVSYTTYRWECAIRGSVVMGFVGAGGLGQRMDESMKMLSGGEVATMLIIFVLLVACADLVSTFLRKRLG